MHLSGKNQHDIAQRDKPNEREAGLHFDTESFVLPQRKSVADVNCECENFDLPDLLRRWENEGGSTQNRSVFAPLW